MSGWCTVTDFDARHPRGGAGKFVEKQNSDTAHNILSSVFETTNGASTVSPGNLDSNVREALTGGQCVAFAVALADEFGDDSITMAVDTTENRVLHAWVYDPTDDDTMIDGNGRYNVEAYLDEFYANRLERCGSCEECNIGEYSDCPEFVAGDADTDVIAMRTTEARHIQASRYGEGLPQQNWDLAATFVDPVLEAS